MASSVKVAVRVRPFNEREKGSKCCVVMNGPTTLLVDPNTGSERTFTFDYSFWSHDGFEADDNGILVPTSPKYADQNVVYEALGKQVLDNAWAGYNCCLFAYGQTGSGKSYSMIGYGANVGIVPISCAQIFERTKSMENENQSYQISMSMLEIYNEKVQDLLVDAAQRPRGGLKIREHKSLGVYVQDLGKHPVDCYEAIEEKMDEGQRNRTIGSTQMNATSSRAHTVIMIEFKQIIKENGRTMEKISNINLVDLAGSEKAGQTGATGDRLKEGSAINQSLTTLGQCISILADKASGKAQGTVVPFRNSSLTRILQTALGGNAKTIMVCALSPSFMNYEETLSTLRYADRAKKIKNQACVNESPQDKIIRELKDENKKLKQMLKKLAEAGGGTVDLKELGLTNMQEMLEDMDENEKIMEDLEKPWEEKLAEEKAKSSKPSDDPLPEQDTMEESKDMGTSSGQNSRIETGGEGNTSADLFNQSTNASQAQDVADEETKEMEPIVPLNPAAALAMRKVKKQSENLEKSVPHMTNLNEDPLMSGIVYIPLTKGEVTIGRKTATPPPDIILGAIGIQKNHGKIKLKQNGLFELSVVAEAAQSTMVNGEPLTVQKRTRVLKHCDRVTFAGCIYVFKYPMLRRALNKLIEASEEIKSQETSMTKKDQEELAWQLLQQNGLEGCSATSPETLTVTDYSAQEKMEDEQAVDWDLAFNEVEFGEKAKQERLNKERNAVQQAELERQKQLMLEQMKQSAQEYEEERKAAQQRQQEEKERIEKEKHQMLAQLEELKQQEQSDQQALNKHQDELYLREHELELARLAMEEKEQEHQRQIEEQKKNFMKKERELESQKTNKIKIDQLTREIKPLIDEANEISKQLSQNVLFTFGLTGSSNGDKGLNVNLQGFELGEKNYDIEVKVNNIDSEEQYIWDRHKFKDRLMVMRDLLATYEEMGEVNDLNNEDNPFVDKREPAIIGEGYYRLEPLSYLIDNPVTINLIGSNYENHGQLELNVIPVDPDGNEDLADEDLPESQEDLLNRRIDFLINIQSAKDLPTNFCKDVFVEYKIYLEETKYKTAVVEGKNRSPEFNYSHQHTQSVVTENFLKYIKNDVLIFKVLGFPDVKQETGPSKMKKKQQQVKDAAQAAMGK